MNSRIRYIIVIIAIVTPMAMWSGTGRADAIRAEDHSALIPLTLEQERIASRLNGMLKCPVCRNQSLASSSSFVAEEMKREIRKMVAEGKSEQEILDYYVDRYTDWILLEPPASGINWGLYLGPVILLLLSIVFVVRWLRRQQEEAVAIARSEPTEQTDPEAVARARDLIDKELSL